MGVAAGLGLLSVVAQAAERDPLKQAALLLEKHYYESAARALRDMPPGATDPALVDLTLGIIYGRNAELHRSLQSFALATEARYLQKLAARQGRDRSRYAALYYGEVLLESGKPAAALPYLTRFQTQPGLDPRYRAIADIKIRRAQAQKAGGRATWGTPPNDAEAQSELAAAVSSSDGGNADAVRRLDQVLAGLKQSATPIPMRVVTNAIKVYADAGRPGPAFVLLQTTDAGRPSYQESIDKDRVILRYYDAALLGNLATLYQRAAGMHLTQAAAVPKYQPMANFLLAENYLRADQVQRAAPLVTTLAAATGLPPAYAARLPLLQAEIDFRTGKQAAAEAAFTARAREYAANPVRLADVVFACVYAGAKCSGALAIAQEALQAGQGELWRKLNFAMGEAQARAGHNEQALTYLENARDKSNKNKIDANDPQLLIRLADLNLEAKNYSENLEVYFELSKEFPAVRQLQEAGQGIYSMEYKSAGDVKIY
jgi:hypothetical protein